MNNDVDIKEKRLLYLTRPALQNNEASNSKLLDIRKTEDFLIRRILRRLWAGVFFLY